MNIYMSSDFESRFRAQQGARQQEEAKQKAEYEAAQQRQRTEYEARVKEMQEREAKHSQQTQQQLEQADALIRQKLEVVGRQMLGSDFKIERTGDDPTAGNSVNTYTWTVYKTETRTESRSAYVLSKPSDGFEGVGQSGNKSAPGWDQEGPLVDVQVRHRVGTKVHVSITEGYDWDKGKPGNMHTTLGGLASSDPFTEESLENELLTPYIRDLD